MRIKEIYTLNKEGKKEHYKVGQDFNGDPIQYIGNVMRGGFGFCSTDFGYSLFVKNKWIDLWYKVLVAELEPEKTPSNWLNDMPIPMEIEYLEAYKRIVIPCLSMEFYLGEQINGRQITSIRECNWNGYIYYICFDLKGEPLIIIEDNSFQSLELEECEPNDGYITYDKVKEDYRLFKLYDNNKILKEDKNVANEIALLDKFMNSQSKIIYSDDEKNYYKLRGKAIHKFLEASLKKFMYDNLNNNAIFGDDRRRIFYSTIRAFNTDHGKEVAFFKGDSKKYYFHTTPYTDYQNWIEEPLDSSLIFVKKVLVLSYSNNIAWNSAEQEKNYFKNQK